MTIDHSEATSEERLTLRVLETLHGGLTTIIDTDDLRIGLEEHLVLCPWTAIAVLIHHLRLDEGRSLSLVVDAELDMVWLSCRPDDLFTDDFPVLACHRFHLTRLIPHTPHDMILMTIHLATNALTFTIDK